MKKVNPLRFLRKNGAIQKDDSHSNSEWKQSITWLGIWLIGAFLIDIVSKVAIRDLLAPYSFKDQLYNFGSDYAVFKTIVYGLTHITTNSYVYHLVFSLPIIITALFVYILTKQKYSQRLAVAASALVLTQTYMLQAVHMLDFSIISAMALPLLVLLATWLHPKQHVLSFVLFGILLAISLSIPFFWIYTLFIIFLARKRFVTLYKNLTKSKKIVLFVPSFLALVIQGIYSLKTRNFGWAIGDADNFMVKSQSFFDVFKNIFIDFDLTTEYKFPLVLSGLAVLAGLSIYVYYQGFHEIQAKVIGLTIFMSYILTSLYLINGLHIILIGTIIMAVNGLAFMLHQWFTVFPRNPIARGFGLLAVFGFVVMCCLVQISAYSYLSAL